MYTNRPGFDRGHSPHFVRIQFAIGGTERHRHRKLGSAEQAHSAAPLQIGSDEKREFGRLLQAVEF